MNISVFVPCVEQHIQWIPALVEAYYNGTERPLEVCICLSGTSKKYHTHVTCGGKYEGFAKITHNTGRLFPGVARNMAKVMCSGEIISYNDADDLPHPERIRIVRHFFESRGDSIMALNHGYYGTYQRNSSLINLSDVQVVNGETIAKHIEKNPDDIYGQFCKFKVAAGPISVWKEVLKNCHWPATRKGQDTAFCKQVALKYRKSVIIDTPLYYYFEERSTGLK